MKDFKIKSAEELEQLSTEELAKYFNDLNVHKKEELEELTKQLKENASKEIEEKITELKAEIAESNAEQIKVIQNALKEQGLAITKIMSRKDENGKESLAVIIGEKKEELKDIAKGANKELVLKANTFRSSIANSELAFILPDIGQLAHKRLTLYDIFPKLPVSTDNDSGVITYYDWDEATTVRAAAAIAEGGTFPESTAKWVTKHLPLQKVGDTLPVSEEFFADNALFAAELNFFLETNVNIKVDEEIATGDGTGAHLTGIVNAGQTYTATAQGITDANVYDLIVDMHKTGAATGGAKYMYDVAIAPLAVIQQMKLKKDANNNYVLPPFVSADGKTVDGMLVIESESIPANHLVIADRRYGKIYEKAGVIVSKGYVDQQFVEDMMTLKVKKRLAFLLREADSGAMLVCKDVAAALITLGS